MRPPEPPPGVRVVTTDTTTAWLREGYDGLFLESETLLGPAGFSSVAGLDDGAPKGGRGAAPTLDLPDRPGERAIWRHYRRGGVLGPLLKDGFRDAWRPMRELALSDALRDAGVATPLTIAAMTHRASGGWHTGDLLTLVVPQAEDLGVFARRTAALPAAEQASARRGAADAVAGTLAALHDAGGRHRDLNCANILVRGGSGGWRAWIIDLDKSPPLGEPLDDRTRASQLLRLARSAAKLRAAGAAISPRDVVRVFRAYARRHPPIRNQLGKDAGRGGRLVHSVSWWIGRRLG